VSLLEAVCTGQLYLPTIVFVLKESTLRLRALGYLLLYNLMFIFPLLLILILALFGTTSEHFSQFLKKHLVIMKVSMAILLLRIRDYFGGGAIRLCNIVNPLPYHLRQQLPLPGFYVPLVIG